MLGSKNEKGQATIEFALALPLLVIFVMLIAQFSIVARQQLALWEVARNAARYASVSPDPQLAAQEIATQNGFPASAVVLWRFVGFPVILSQRSHLSTKVEMRSFHC